MTPMVDVTFLILIFFMVTASFSVQSAIQTPNPNSDLPSKQVSQQTVDSLRLQVDQHGSFLLMASNWQKELVGKQSLVTELVAAKANASVKTDLTIEVESEARLQMLVDAIDAATIAGFDQFQLTEIDSEMI